MTRIKAVSKSGMFEPTEPVYLEDGTVVNLMVDVPSRHTEVSGAMSPYEMLQEIAALPLASRDHVDNVAREHDVYLYRED